MDQYEIAVKIKSRVLDFLSIKPRTEYEIRNKIKNVAKSMNVDFLDKSVLDRIEEDIVVGLKKIRLIDDSVYASDFVKEKINSRNPQNKFRIKQFLSRKRISPPVIEEALKGFTPEDETKIIEKEIDKKIRTIKEKNPYLLKMKLKKYLVSKGYNFSLIHTVVDSYLDVK